MIDNKIHELHYLFQFSLSDESEAILTIPFSANAKDVRNIRKKLDRYLSLIIAQLSVTPAQPAKQG